MSSLASFRFFCLTLLFSAMATSLAAPTQCGNRDIYISETSFDAVIVGEPFYLGPPDFSVVLVLTQAGTLYRSLDSGKSFSIVDLPPQSGTRKGAVSVEIAPDTTHVIVVGYQNNIWVSNDAGKRFTPVAAPGLMDNFNFHARVPKWVLATKNGCPGENCHDDLYYSNDGGLSWTMLLTYVMDYDWHGEADKDAKTIIVWQKIDKTGRQDRAPYRYNVVKSTTLFQTEPQVISDNAEGFLVLNDHIFIAQGGWAEGLHLLASSDGGLNFSPVKFPGGVKETRYTILDVSEGMSFINVEFENNNWGNVYSAPNVQAGFAISLRHNVRGYGRHSTQFKRVDGLEGIYFANVYTSIEDVTQQGKYIQSMISYDKGGRWKRLPRPIDVNCTSTNAADCQLNLVHSSFYTHPTVPGLMIATGNTGQYLTNNPGEMQTWMSRDAGLTWENVDNSTGSFAYDFGNRGSIIIAAEITALTNNVSFSLDEGLNWEACTFATSQGQSLVDLDGIANDPNSDSKTFLVWGKTNRKGFILTVDFTALQARECAGFNVPGTQGSDYEIWEPAATKGSCLLGRKTQLVRRRRDANCWVPTGTSFNQIVVKNCSCTQEDYECDFCYEMDETGKCVLDLEDCPGYDPKSQPYPCLGHWHESRGYRLVSGDTCDPTTGVNLLPIKRQCHNEDFYPPSYVPNLEPEQSAATTGVLVVVLLIFISLFAFFGLYVMSGRSERVRNVMLFCLPERILPELSLPTAQYGIMLGSDALEDDMKRDAAILELGPDSDDEAPNSEALL